MLVAANALRCLTELLIIVSGLAVQDPRERPPDKQGSADRAHATFADPRSDFLALLNLWRFFEQARQEHSRSGLKRELEQRFLSPSRMHEWRELHRQLLLAVREQGMTLNDAPADYASVHQAVLSGSLSLIGLHDEKGEYQGPRNLRFRVFPGSALADRTPRWLMAGEIVETRRIYARCVAAVEPAWIEAAAGHLVKRNYSEPHWSERRGEVLAYETVLLYGLPLVERRRISYARIDPDLCRTLMIRDGLVAGAVARPPPFLEHNLALVTELLDEEARGRQRGLLIAEGAQADLYEARLPTSVCSMTQLERWWRRAGEAERRALFFDRHLLTDQAGRPITEDDFPSSLTVRGVEFPLKYRFAPGEPDDGISVRVPLGMLSALVGEALEWSVPGFFGPVCGCWPRCRTGSRRCCRCCCVLTAIESAGCRWRWRGRWKTCSGCASMRPTGTVRASTPTC
jgi:ATP-dependent helicase HrpA